VSWIQGKFKVSELEWHTACWTLTDMLIGLLRKKKEMTWPDKRRIEVQADIVVEFDP